MISVDKFCCFKCGSTCAGIRCVETGTTVSDVAGVEDDHVILGPCDNDTDDRNKEYQCASCGEVLAYSDIDLLSLTGWPLAVPRHDLTVLIWTGVLRRPAEVLTCGLDEVESVIERAAKFVKAVYGDNIDPDGVRDVSTNLRTHGRYTDLHCDIIITPWPVDKTEK